MNFTEGESGTLSVIDEFRDTVQLEFDADAEPGLRSDGPGLTAFTEVGYDPQERHHTETTGFTAPPVAATVVDLAADGPEHRQLTDGDTAAVGPDTAVILRTPVLVHVRADGTGRVRRTAEAVEVEFDQPTEIEIGFESRHQDSPGSIYVEESLDGVARGLSALGCNTQTTTPDRSFPNVRKQPPRMRFRDRESVDGALADCPDTDTEVVVPGTDDDGLAHLLPTAGLLHYLGAEATVDPDASGTHLRVGPETFHLGDDPETTDQTASALLRTVFFLDCLARTGGPYGTDLVERELLDELGLDAVRLYDTPLAERVRRYLDTTGVLGGDTGGGDGDGGNAGGDFLDRLPEWHLGLHVDPELERVPALSHYLGRLADVYSPSGAQLETLTDRGRWSQRTTRSRQGYTAGDVMVGPEQRARTVGWHGPRRALQAFNVVGDGLPRLRPLTDGDLSVTVVQASEEFLDDEAVADYYRDRDLPMDVRVLSRPGVAGLRRAFERPTDLLHFVGHCEDSGLRCHDGTLAAEEIDECDVEAFFLNACGSLGFGEELVERGAVAGAATTRAVFGETAAQVGCDWARLVAHGWSVERALDVARSVDDPSGYVSVGDGTHVVSKSDVRLPPEVRFEREPGTDTTRVLNNRSAPHHAGSWELSRLTNQTRLSNTWQEYEVQTERVQYAFKDLQSPIIYDGELHWEVP